MGLVHRRQYVQSHTWNIHHYLFGNRPPMRFGKREFDEELNEFKILRSARAPMRFGKRSDTTKRAPMRFGKRAPMRFGKRDYEAPSFMNYYNDDYVVREDYI